MIGLSTSYQTQIALSCSGVSSGAFGIVEILLSDLGDYVQWDLSQTTANGSIGSASPVPLDPTVRIPAIIVAVNAGSEGTIVSDSSAFNLTVKGAFRWTAAPGNEIVTLGGTASLGYALRAKSATYTGIAPVQMTFSV